MNSKTTPDYNSALYAAKAFEESITDTNENKEKKGGSKAVIKRDKYISPTLMEDFVEAVAKAKQKNEPLNPFLTGFEFDIVKANGDKIETDAVFDDQGRKVETRHTTIKYVDKSQFLKIYPSMLGAIIDMNKSGVRMFGIVLNRLRENDGKDFINLRWDDGHLLPCTEGPVAISMSRSDFYRGVSELERLKILAKRDPDHFFINPSFIFNGNRITFCQRFIMKENGQSQ